MKIKKLLIANRGEIALRVMRTAKEMGYSIAGIYSDQDKEAAHITLADEKVYLPGDKLSDTYLNIDAIIKAAKETGADAIHPGYGFLSENPNFAESCEKEGIIFVGPSSEAIRAMGNKIAARKIATDHGIPVTPGLTGTPEQLLADHVKVGFPVLIKAAAGGGGKGMRIVRTENEIESAILSTSSEAKNYFGDGTVYIERFFENPRHIEVQILGDRHGNIIHLFERECSMQRRHQKIIEEAPSITLTAEIREKICSAAVQMARSIEYFSAGTIEFLVDKDLNFYFLEMNTRIQVEHPVTEMITGIDIVRQQFLVAEGKPLSITQKDINIKGHAVEVRVYAENPASNFMPSPGKIKYYSFPAERSVRMEEPKLHHNSEVFSNFDPMISKVIAWGENRDAAIESLTEFLPHYAILGIHTNIPFLLTLLKLPDYLANRLHTRYIDDHLTEINALSSRIKDSLNKEIPLIGALIYSLNYHSHSKSPEKNHKAQNGEISSILHSHSGNSRLQKPNIWKQIGYWRLYQQIHTTLDEQENVIIINSKEGCSIDYTLDEITGKAALSKNTDGSYNLELNGKQYKLYLTGQPDNVQVQYGGYIFNFDRKDIAANDHITLPSVQIHKADSGDIISPMPGKVLAVKAAEGMNINKGELLMVIEAMKMENNILAPYDGVIDKILVKVGDNVDASSHLMHLTKLSADVTDRA
ncbi:MAG TPA: biotin carboxylase N-terminal domain-containing protein [Lentimicrobium sp.]|nr:biotin carboxylase N-terminal domain-containing protein [Lentimicrobium sp.]